MEVMGRVSSCNPDLHVLMPFCSQIILRKGLFVLWQVSYLKQQTDFVFIQVKYKAKQWQLHQGMKLN